MFNASSATGFDANTVNAIAAVANVAIAALALLVASVSIYFTAKSLSLQRKHNRLSVKPIPFLALSKIGGITIELQNHGFGPFIIEEFKVLRADESFPNITGLLPENPPLDVEVTCTTGMYKRTVAVDQKIEIARIAIINLSHEAVAYLNQCRLNFYNASIKIGYSDIYNDKFDRYQKDLDWLCKA